MSASSSSSSSSIGPSSKLDPVRLGDCVHLLSLLLIFIYAATVIWFPQYLDDEWKDQGFCVATYTSPTTGENSTTTSSHDWSWYADLVLAPILLILYFVWKDQLPSNATISQSIPVQALAILAHGAGHYSISQMTTITTSEVPSPADEFSSTTTTRYDFFNSNNNNNIPDWQICLVLMCGFWIPMLLGTMPRGSWWSITAIAAVAATGMLYLGRHGPQYIFSYIQTVLITTFSMNQLGMRSREEKATDREYWLVPIVVELPILVMGWVECLFCQSWYRGIGGHVWFDASIGITLIVLLMTIRAKRAGEEFDDKVVGDIGCDSEKETMEVKVKKEL